MPAKTVDITNTRGLHARAAAKFVKLAETFDADVTVKKGAETAPGDSIMELLMLGASKDTEIEIETTGDDFLWEV